MNIRVWALHHDWGDDSETRLFPSQEAARDAIWSYVMDQWDEGYMDDVPLPADRMEAIDTYFEYHSDEEWHNIWSQLVEFPGIPELPNEEVILTPEECEVVVMALEVEGLALIARAAGLAPSEKAADKLIQSAYQKLKD